MGTLLKKLIRLFFVVVVVVVVVHAAPSMNIGNNVAKQLCIILTLARHTVNGQY